LMEKYFASILLLLTLLVSGCSDSAQQPGTASPTDIPVGESQTAPTEAGSNAEVLCNISLNAMQDWADSLPYEEVVLVPQTYMDESSLILWLVDTTLLPAYPEVTQELAANRAINAAAELARYTYCVLKFDNIHASVVDADYFLWFSGSIRTVDLPGITTKESGAGTAEAEGGGRVLPSTGDQNSPSTCTWKDASQSLDKHFAEQNQPAVFYYIRDGGGANLFAHFTVPNADAARPVEDWISGIHAQVSCLQPNLDGLSITLILPDGRILMTGYQPVDKGGYDPGAFSYSLFDQP
jgi:hypothetical protein